ncbi:MAG: hypothetical protein C0501_28405 [Isosphaera sp.]|nr:hypothetical protein [Isosphaera sp.]
MTLTRRARPAITLIEMMVAMALTLVIMLILTESFKISLDFVRGANSTGTMMYQLNGAGTILVRDLKAEHFLREDQRPNGGVRLSDQRSDVATWTAPKRGFFRVECPAAGVAATDGDSFTVRTATNHRLHFTVILPGLNDSNLAAATAGGTTYKSRAYEVAYFLVPTGSTTPGGGQPLHDLVRRYRLAAPTGEGTALAPAAAADPAGDIISRRVAPPAADDDDDDDVAGNPPGPVNTLGNLRNAANRMPLTRFPVGGARYGEDILASNVLSFEIQTDWSTPGNPTAAPAFPGNTDYPYGGLPTPGGVYDTATVGPGNQRIKQLSITIRVYDPRMKQSRQNTWKVAM